MTDVGAAELLKFVKIANRTVTLTDAGKKYLTANDRTRRVIWKEQLLTITLFRKAVTWLKSASKHTLSQKELTDLIMKELPKQNPQVQCKTLISWGSYGNLFTYHKGARTLSLKEEKK